MRNRRRCVFVVCVLLGLAVAALPRCYMHRGQAHRDQSPTDGTVAYRYRAVGSVTLPRKAGGRMGLAAAPEGGVPSLDEEIWVIQRPRVSASIDDEEAPGAGSLLVKDPEGEEDVPVPLRHTDVEAFISGYISTVEVTQQFHNPYEEKIEAVYVFPLPRDAAVNEFLMIVGERRIRGIIREREEAERIYREARSQGYVASLLTQERPNIFTQSLANIEPGKDIDIRIRYFHTLPYRDGAFEFVFPMVVGPRYNSSRTTDGVAALPRGRQGGSGQKTAVTYLRPNERSGHDISVRVHIDAGVAVEKVESISHVIRSRRSEDAAFEVELNELDSIPNRDFVLRYQVAGDEIKAGLMTHRDERGAYFTLMLVPPADLRSLTRAPLEMVFVLDCSGSMDGEPISQGKAAIRRALRKLQPNDSFQVIRFSNDASRLGPKPMEVTSASVSRGLKYVDSLRGQGGTEMIQGIKAALDFPHDPARLRVVSFLTDGFIGDEAEILEAVQKRIGASRIFSFGVGSAPNRFLLERMAKLGRGVVAYVGPGDSASDVMDLFIDRIGHPAMTDLSVDWGGMRAADVYPARIPDLFVGRPVILTGRFEGQGVARVRVRGKVGGEERTLVLPLDLSDAATAHAGIPSVWARMKIADLMDRGATDPSADLAEGVRQVALDYGLLSAYTAFVAVDSLTRTSGSHGTTVAVPVPVPEGVRYETTVDEK